MTRPCATKGCSNTSDRLHGFCPACITVQARASRLEDGKPEFIDDELFYDQLAASFLLASASNPASPPTAADRDAGFDGDAGPMLAAFPGARQSVGEVRRARSASPTTKKERPAATGRSLTTAG